MFLQSETFYRQIEVAEEAAAGAEMASPVTRALTGGHEFAQKHITGHPIWQDQQFWEEAFYR